MDTPPRLTCARPAPECATTANALALGLRLPWHPAREVATSASGLIAVGPAGPAIPTCEHLCEDTCTNTPRQRNGATPRDKGSICQHTGRMICRRSPLRRALRANDQARCEGLHLGAQRRVMTHLCSNDHEENPELTGTRLERLGGSQAPRHCCPPPTAPPTSNLSLKAGPTQRPRHCEARRGLRSSPAGRATSPRGRRPLKLHRRGLVLRRRLPPLVTNRRWTRNLEGAQSRPMRPTQHCVPNTPTPTRVGIGRVCALTAGRHGRSDWTPRVGVGALVVHKIKNCDAQNVRDRRIREIN